MFETRMSTTDLAIAITVLILLILIPLTWKYVQYRKRVNAKRQREVDAERSHQDWLRQQEEAKAELQTARELSQANGLNLFDYLAIQTQELINRLLPHTTLDDFRQYWPSKQAHSVWERSFPVVTPDKASTYAEYDEWLGLLNGKWFNWEAEKQFIGLASSAAIKLNTILKLGYRISDGDILSLLDQCIADLQQAASLEEVAVIEKMGKRIPGTRGFWCGVGRDHRMNEAIGAARERILMNLGLATENVARLAELANTAIHFRGCSYAHRILVDRILSFCTCPEQVDTIINPQWGWGAELWVDDYYAKAISNCQTEAELVNLIAKFTSQPRLERQKDNIIRRRVELQLAK
jgi:hypothetical protein